MTVGDDVLQVLHGSAAAMTDSELAALLGKRHQYVNQTCRALADEGMITRNGSRGEITNRLSTASPSPAVEVSRPVPGPDAADDWAWEGNMQSSVVSHLAATGWMIVAVADTARRERGIDIIAERAGSRLLIEVKGRPTTTYARGERAGQNEPTLQATHWFAEGISTLIRVGEATGTELALALPDEPRYRNLLIEAGWALDRLDMAIYLVAADGSVQTWNREN
jgi:hypothetical protein